jgi:hypothetical protein
MKTVPPNQDNLIGTSISSSAAHISGFLLHNHIINKKKSFSGDVNYEANFPFFFCFISNGPYTPPLTQVTSS